YAFSQRQAAVTAEQQAIADGKQANSRAIAFVADQHSKMDPAAAAQLAAAAYGVAQTPQATGALLDASDAPSVARIEDSAGIVQWVNVSPNHQLLVAAGADGSLRLWNVAQPGRPVALATLVPADADHPLYTAVFSPDGSMIAAAGANRVVHLLRVTGGAAAPQVTPAGAPLTGPGDTIDSVAVSPDGTLLAAGSAEGTVRLWHVAEPAHAAPDGQPLSLPPAKPHVNSVAFSA